MVFVFSNLKINVSFLIHILWVGLKFERSKRHLVSRLVKSWEISHTLTGNKILSVFLIAPNLSLSLHY